MISKTTPAEPDSPETTLQSIQTMTRSAYRHALPPVWYGCTLAVLGGLILGLASTGVSRLYLAPILLIMVAVVLYQTRASGVVVKLEKIKLVAVFIGAVAAAVFFVFGARELSTFIGFWACLIVGVVTAALVYLISALERNTYIANIDKENNT